MYDQQPRAEDNMPEGHPKIALGRIGVLLVNLGTPDATDYRSMRRYLSEFLSDRRVIELPRIFWYPILQGIILSVRPSRSGKAYRRIWNEEQNESPLLTITRNQSKALTSRLHSRNPDIAVDFAMRYGNPSIASRLNALKAEGCERILLFPLYPQYCAATTASVNDAAFSALMKMRWQPAIRIVPPYFDHPAYINAIADSIEEHLAGLSFEPERIVASFHGIPQSYFDQGDPYHCHCQKTARLVREKLQLPAEKFLTTFQSRFGRQEWLRPYTDKTLEALAGEGVESLAVITPGFAADCLETLEEIAMEGGEIFHDHGGKDFSHIPCLNDSKRGIDCLEALVRNELSGWL